MTAELIEIHNSYITMAVYDKDGKFLSNYHVSETNIKQPNLLVGQMYDVVTTEGQMYFWLK